MTIVDKNGNVKVHKLNKQPVIDTEQNKSLEAGKNRLLKLIRNFLKKNKKDEQDQLERFMNLEDWKMLAARIDQIMFIFTFIVVLAVPFYLFGKYALMSDSKMLHKKGCPNAWAMNDNYFFVLFVFITVCITYQLTILFIFIRILSNNFVSF